MYFLGHKTRNKILYPMMLLALRSPHLEGTVIFGLFQSILLLFHPSGARAPTPFLGQSRRSVDSSCIRSRSWTINFPPSSMGRGVCSICTASKACSGVLTPTSLCGTCRQPLINSGRMKSEQGRAACWLPERCSIVPMESQLSLLLTISVKTEQAGPVSVSGIYPSGCDLVALVFQ